MPQFICLFSVFFCCIVINILLWVSFLFMDHSLVLQRGLYNLMKLWAMMLLKCCTQCQQIWKTLQWPQDWKRSVYIPIPKKSNDKDYSNYHTITLIFHSRKVMLKIIQTKFQQYVNWKLADVQAGFWRGRGTRDQIANMSWIMEKAREFQKNIYFCFFDYSKAFDCVDHNKLWKILRDANTRPPYLSPENSVCGSRSNR